MGLAPGARHFYGVIKSWSCHSIIDEAHLHGPDGRSGMDTREQVRGAALAWFREHGKPGDVLIVGKPIYCAPLEIIAGPEPLMSEDNKLWSELERHGGLEDGPEAMAEALYERWESLLKKAEEGTQTT